MTRSALYSLLNCPLLTASRWSAFNVQARRAVFSIWADRLQGRRYVLWPAAHHPSMDAYNADRHRDIAEEVLAAAGSIEALGIWQEARDVNVDPRSIKWLDGERILVLWLVRESNGDIVAIVEGEVGIKEAMAGPVRTHMQRFDRTGVHGA